MLGGAGLEGFTGIITGSECSRGNRWRKFLVLLSRLSFMTEIVFVST